MIIAGPEHSRGADTAFFSGDEQALLATPEMPGAVVAIERLVRLFAGQVWLVSKCGPRVQARTLRWLDGHDFFARTGLAPDQLRFCRTRPDKRIHCLELDLTHFVDDRADVHTAIRGTVDHHYLFGSRPHPTLPFVRVTPDWAVAEHLIRATLRSDGVS